MPNNFKLHH